MVVRYRRKFKKDYRRLPPKTRNQFKLRLNLFLVNRSHSTLRIHKLSGQYTDCFSMNVSGDVRAIFKYQDGRLVVLFLAIGSHSQLYK